MLEASGQFPAICVLQGTSKAVAGWGIASTGLRSSLVTIGAGTAITSVTAATTAAANTGATPIMTRAAAVSATQAVLGYLSNAGGGYPYFIAATENAGALNFSTQPFHISSVLGTGNIVGFDVTSGNSTQPRAVVSVVSTLGCRMATVDVSGTGTGAKLMWGDTIVVGDACTTGAYSSRLIKVSNDTYVRFAAGPDQTGGVSPTLVAVLTASIVTARDNGLEVEAGAMNIARQLAKLGLDGAVFGNNIVCAYADGDNSGFATARAIPLNSVV